MLCFPVCCMGSADPTAASWGWEGSRVCGTSVVLPELSSITDLALMAVQLLLRAVPEHP